MRRIFNNATYTATFKEALREVHKHGKEVKPRGMLTKEISPAVMACAADRAIYPSLKRNLNFAFLFAENLWYISGRADTNLLSFYNSQIKSFSQDGLHDGAYGPKIMAQIRYAVETLKVDTDSRQSIISLWERNPRPSKDVPCTSLFQFLIRDGKLNLCVTMRSNDIIFGSNYDMPSFAMIQMVVASCLGIPPGHLFLTANSLHLYETHFNLAQELLAEEVPSHLELRQQLTPPPMVLEEHVKQIDILLMYESTIRHLGHRSLNFTGQAKQLCPFYRQYVLMFAMYAAMKSQDMEFRGICLSELQAIESPMYDIYKERFDKRPT